MYTNILPSEAVHRELYIFCDVSPKAIATVAYLKVTDADKNCEIAFVMGKVKLMSRSKQTIPRLELFAGVLTVELADSTNYCTDSTVVLGYIYSETRRFYVYVSNNVAWIRGCS